MQHPRSLMPSAEAQVAELGRWGSSALLPQPQVKVIPKQVLNKRDHDTQGTLASPKLPTLQSGLCCSLFINQVEKKPWI